MSNRNVLCGRIADRVNWRTQWLIVSRRNSSWLTRYNRVLEWNICLKPRGISTNCKCKNIVWIMKIMHHANISHYCMDPVTRFRKIFNINFHPLAAQLFMSRERFFPSAAIIIQGISRQALYLFSRFIYPLIARVSFPSSQLRGRKKRSSSIGQEKQRRERAVCICCEGTRKKSSARRT